MDDEDHQREKVELALKKREYGGWLRYLSLGVHRKMSYDRFIRMLEGSDSAEMTEEDCRKWLKDERHGFGMSDDDVAPKIRITAYGDIPVRKGGQKFSEGAAEDAGRVAELLEQNDLLS